MRAMRGGVVAIVLDSGCWRLPERIELLREPDDRRDGESARCYRLAV